MAMQSGEGKGKGKWPGTPYQSWDRVSRSPVTVHRPPGCVVWGRAGQITLYAVPALTDGAAPSMNQTFLTEFNKSAHVRVVIAAVTITATLKSYYRVILEPVFLSPVF